MFLTYKNFANIWLGLKFEVLKGKSSVYLAFRKQNVEFESQSSIVKLGFRIASLNTRPERWLTTSENRGLDFLIETNHGIRESRVGKIYDFCILSLKYIYNAP